MKKMFLHFICYLTMVSCSASNIQDVEPKKDSTFYYKYDSLLIVTNKTIDSLKNKNKEQKDLLFLSNYKLEKIKYYIKIVDKKSSQIVFLKGWIKRTLNQN